MRLHKKIMISILILFFAGFVAPRLVIPSGYDKIPPELEEQSKFLISDASNLLSNPFENMIITKIRVMDVKIDENNGTYEALLRAYSLFGTAYADVKVSETSAYIINRNWFKEN